MLLLVCQRAYQRERVCHLQWESLEATPKGGSARQCRDRRWRRRGSPVGWTGSDPGVESPLPIQPQENHWHSVGLSQAGRGLFGYPTWLIQNCFDRVRGGPARAIPSTSINRSGGPVRQSWLRPWTAIRIASSLGLSAIGCGKRSPFRWLSGARLTD